MTATHHSETQNVGCPACGTRFRLRAEQLLQAEGLVRCGICMHIFNAEEHLSPDEPSPPAEPVTPETEQECEAAEPNPVAREAEEQRPSEPEETPPDEVDESVLHAEPSDDAKSEDHASEDQEAGAKEEDRDNTSAGADIDTEEVLSKLSTVDHGFEHHQPAARRYRPGPWLLLNSVAALLLVAQLLYWQRDWVMTTPYREPFLALCTQLKLDCAAKQADAPMQVVSQNLLIRKHPDRDDALIIDSILLNQGDTASDFPLLYLRFSDLNNREIASRIFSPGEYLSGELDASAKLNSRQPVHIVLEIADPGELAVNYKLTLLRP